MKFIGLDLGTSSLKAILVDEDQQTLAEHAVPLTVTRPHSGWSEQDPQSWCDGAVTALKALAANNDCSDVAGIGLAGHMHGATLIDKDDAVLRPCMLWNDTRSHAQAAAMDSTAQFRDLTGNIVFPGFTAPKVDWVRENEPETFAKIAKVLLPKDYLRLFLTGEHVSDMNCALILLPKLVCHKPSSQVVQATTRQLRLGQVWSKTAPLLYRLAPPACCSRLTTVIGLIRQLPCIRFATLCLALGTRWA